MKALEARGSALKEAIARDAQVIEAEKEAVRMDRQKVKEEMAAVRRAKDTYETGVRAIEAVLSEAEAETLSYDPETERTTMRDPTPVKAAAPKLRKQITKLAKRLATKVGKVDAQNIVMVFFQNEAHLELGIGLFRLFFEVPFTVFAPAISDRKASEPASPCSVQFSPPSS